MSKQNCTRQHTPRKDLYLYVMFIPRIKVYKFGRSKHPALRRRHLMAHMLRRVLLLSQLRGAGHLETPILQVAGRPLWGREFFGETEELRLWRERKLPISELPFLTSSLYMSLRELEGWKIDTTQIQPDYVCHELPDCITTMKIITEEQEARARREWEEVTMDSGWPPRWLQHVESGLALPNWA